MSISLATPSVDRLACVLEPLREWQVDGSPIQLHPGDIGWFWRFGPAATAAAVRTWSRDGRILAVGLLDGPGLLRLGIAPDAHADVELARAVVADVTDPGRGVLPDGEAGVESPPGALVQDLLGESGWGLDEPWTLLRRDLIAPVEVPGARVEEAGTGHVDSLATVHRSAFAMTHTHDQVRDRWRAAMAGAPYADARCLLIEDDGRPAAAATVWSAGPGRYGLVEPMGVHADHRSRGHGRAVTLAGAAALRALGSSAAIVATTSSNVGAVATYVAAGFEVTGERRDRIRAAR